MIGEVFFAGELVGADDFSVSVDVSMRAEEIVGAGDELDSQAMGACRDGGGQFQRPVGPPDPTKIFAVECELNGVRADFLECEPRCGLGQGDFRLQMDGRAEKRIACLHEILARIGLIRRNQSE